MGEQVSLARALFLSWAHIPFEVLYAWKSLAPRVRMDFHCPICSHRRNFDVTSNTEATYERPRVNLKIEQGSAFQQQGRKIFTKVNGQSSTKHMTDRFEHSHSESQKIIIMFQR